MDDLTAFLSARLDEDEQWALLAAGATKSRQPSPWRADHRNVFAATGERMAIARSASVAPHIAKQDPARALREVTAMRAILAQREHSPAGSPVLVNALYQIAAIWSDHPDYRREWAPTGSRASG